MAGQQPARLAGAKAVRFPWLARFIGAAMAVYLRLVARTCRITDEVTRDQVVLAFWHECDMAAFVTARKMRGDLPHASFSTQGFRGTVITTLLERSGTPIRIFELPPEGDRSAGRAFAIKLARLARDGFSLIVTPDGPFGPLRIAKPGTLIVARASGLAVQPWGLSVHPSIQLKGRWDRQLLPLPFCRIRVREGRRMAIGAREPIKPRLAELQAELERVTSLAEA
jgi:lysophospholipid acyltransferase (LPLAT)-like uncharacterized protein